MSILNSVAGLPRSLGAILVAGALVIAGVVLWVASPKAAEPAVLAPPPAYDPPSTATSGTAVLAGGCFWGMQGVFQHVKGVTRVVSGYSGGTVANPTYEQVSSETTGHAESIEITYDPSEVSYGTLLRVYFSVAHNPTQLNYQGPDHGTSYRSNIFYVSEEQKKISEAYIAQLTQSGTFEKPIVTRLDPLNAFYRAEDYHQDYMLKHPSQPYIVVNDAPKLVNLKRLFPELYMETPVTLARAG